jgi:hypothetical protein
MTRTWTSLAATLVAGVVMTAPTTVSAQISANRPQHMAPPPANSWSPRQPAYTVDLFRGDRLNRVRAQIARGEFEKARMALDGRRSEIRTPEGEYLLGVVSANLGNYKAASEAFRSSLLLDKAHIGASVGAALTDLRLGRRDRAEEIARMIEARRTSCAAGCGDAASLNRASQVLDYFLKQA